MDTSEAHLDKRSELPANESSGSVSGEQIEQVRRGSLDPGRRNGRKQAGCVLSDLAVDAGDDVKHAFYLSRPQFAVFVQIPSRLSSRDVSQCQKGLGQAQRYRKSTPSLFPANFRSGRGTSKHEVVRPGWTASTWGFCRLIWLHWQPVRISWHGKLEVSPEDIGANRDTQSCLWSLKLGLTGTSPPPRVPAGLVGPFHSPKL